MQKRSERSTDSPGLLPTPGQTVFAPVVGEEICDKSPEPDSRTGHVHVLHEKHVSSTYSLSPTKLNIRKEKACQTAIDPPAKACIERTFFLCTPLIKEDKESETSQLSCIS